MAREKVTITLDRAKVAVARTLLGAASTSEVVDIALDRLVRAETLRRDVAAYRRTPQTPAEHAFVDLADTTGLSDDTDWAALYDVENT